MIVIIMGTTDEEFVEEIDFWCAGSCRGMVVGMPQGDIAGSHGLAPGGGGGDQSDSMAGTNRRVAAGRGFVGGTSRGEGCGPRSGEGEERLPSPDSV